MLANSDLLASLNELDQKFNTAQNNAEAQRFAKYALLELCGWIEEAQDYIINSCARKLTETDLVDFILEKVKRNSGFDHEANFVPLLSMVIGLIQYESIRIKLRANGSYFSVLENSLTGFKTGRNAHAHSHFEINNAKKLQHLANCAPSRLKLDAQQVFSGFYELEQELIVRGFI